MAIVVETEEQVGALGDYDALLSTLGRWINRTDLTVDLPTFVVLYEARCNRELRVRGMEAALNTTALTDGAATLPDGFLAFKELRYDGSPSYTLEPRPLEWIRNRTVSSARPCYFAINNTQVVCDGAGSITGTYYEKLPNLAEYSTNWLFTGHPDAYLFGALVEAGFYVRDKELLAYATARTDKLIETLNGTDRANQINGGPLTVRAR